MSGFTDEALKKLREGAKEVKGQKELAMASSVRGALENFCRQDEEFAQAVAQGGSFAKCMGEVAKGVGNSISDLDAYTRAVQFYFPGAAIRMQMSIDLIGAAGDDTEETKAEAPGEIVLDLMDFL